MIKPIITIHNAETDEIETREMNDTEFAVYQAQLEELEKEKQAEQDLFNKRQALLNRLGITDEEARLLLA